MSSIELRSVHKAFGSVKVLKGIDLTVDEGEFLVLVGPSGCGKSTLLSLIAGFEDITSGDILIGGKNYCGVHPSARNIAMVFQSYALYPSMTVGQNMSFGLEMRNIPKPERTRKVNEVAQTLQIAHLLGRRPGQLSGGQRQRVAMGRALVRDPQVFLFDEPLSNLDAKLRVEMRTEIKRLHQTLKTTMVYVTHDQIEALTLASKIAVLKDGELQQYGTPDEIYRQPTNVFVAEFMGSPAMNLLPGRIEKTASRQTVKVVTPEDGELSIDVVAAGNENPGDGVEITVGIRPEAFTFVSDPEAPHATRFSVEIVEPAGADTFVVLDWCGQEVTARIDTCAHLSAGKPASFQVDETTLSFFDRRSGQRLSILAATSPL